MYLVHEDSTEATLPSLNLFGVPPTQTAVRKKQNNFNFYPVSESSDKTPLEFSISGSGT